MERLPERPVKRPDSLEAFELGGLHVQPRVGHAGDGSRPYFEVTQSVRRPDGTERTQKFVIAADRLGELAERARQVFPAQRPEQTPRREAEVTRPERATEERSGGWWPVVRPMRLFGESIITKVEYSFRTREEAELKAYETGLFAWHEGFGHEPKRGDRLLTEHGKNPKLDDQRGRLAAEELQLRRMLAGGREPQAAEKAKPAEFWPVVQLKETVGTGALVEVVKVFTDRGEQQLWAHKRSKYLAYPHPLPTEPKVGQRLAVAGGVDRKFDQRIDDFRVTQEYNRRHAKVNLDTGLTPELRSEIRPVWSKTVGDKGRYVFDRVDEQGRRERRVLLTQTIRGADGTSHEVTREFGLEEYRERARLAAERKQARTRGEEGGPKPVPGSPREEVRSGASYHERYAAYLERLLYQETKQHFAVGVWDGGGVPKKGELVRWKSGLEWGHEPGRGWGVKEQDGRVTPLFDTPGTGRSEGPRYVVAERSNLGSDVFRVVGSTKHADYARGKAAAFERSWQADQQRQLEALYRQAEKPPQQRDQQPRPGETQGGIGHVRL